MFAFLKTNPEAEPSDRSAKLKMILIVGGALLGIFLLLFGSGAFHTQSETKTEESTDPTSEEELILYQTYLEERVKAICESVNGVGNVTAIVSLDSGFESVYAIEDVDGNTQYVVLGSGSSASALFLTESPPAVRGIGVVCTGGNNATVRRELTSLLAAAFHISSNRIYVTGSS